MRIQHLSKTYGNIIALEGIELTFDAGVVGVLGGKGAGKTTLFRILLGVEKPSLGRVWHHNVPIDNHTTYYDALGYAPQDFTAPKQWKVRDYVQYIGGYKGLSKEEVMKGCAEWDGLFNKDLLLNKRIGSLSPLELHSLGIAQAFLGSPKVLFLDDPFSHHDGEEIARLKGTIGSYGDKHLVIVSSEEPSHLEGCCKEVVILAKGKVAVHGKVEDLIQGMTGVVWEDVGSGDRLDILQKIIQSIGGIVVFRKSVSERECRMCYVFKERLSASSKLALPTLTDVYLSYTGGERIE